MNKKQIISKSDLILIANHLIQQHSDYLPDMRADSVSEQNGVVVFKGDCLLDKHGFPSTHTPKAFNIFKYLTLRLSKEFTLQP
ncbi:DUF2498 family protein [Vibrio ostreicida]|uniref:DUF2498 family protein n=1 Tax=Vibrio ostreicida TaxID=526588 RepID=UPI003B5BC8D7